MKILQLNTEKTWRGGERQTLFSILGLIQKGLNCKLLTLRGSYMHSKSESMAVPLILVKNNLTAFLKICIIGKKFDIIHAQTAKTHTLAVLSKFIHRARVVYTRRVDFFPKGFFTKLKYKFTDEVIAISPEIAVVLYESGMREKCDVISSTYMPTQINLTRAKQLKEDLDIANKTKVVGVVAALESHKDPYTSVDTALELLKKRNDFVFLHFGSGSLHTKVQKYIEDSNLSGKYLLMGYVENVEDFFGIMDVFLMSSEKEGLGSSVFDAFYNEVFVVSTNAGGLKGLVNDRGKICKVSDYHCLSNEIDKFFNSKTKPREVAIAKKYCTDNISLEKITEKYILCYRKLK